MKNSRKFAAFVASILAVACMAAPMATSFSAEAAGSNTITINPADSDKGTHTYAAYQIFAGTYDTGVLKDITWGSGVNGEALLAALKGDATIGSYFTDCTTAEQVAEALAKTETQGESSVAIFEDDSTKTQVFAKIVAANLSSTTSGTVSGNAISGLDDGYYLVKDASAPTLPTDAVNSGAYTRFIVKVTNSADVTVDEKAAAPTVDKQVLDEIGDAEDGAIDGWGESADHAINETFQFKLTATLPVSTEYAAYETYKVIFNDTMSVGVTYESIASVTVDGVTIDADKYEVAGVNSGEAGKTWTLTIADIKTAGTGINLTDGADIVVIYNAHLNENAVISSESATDLGVDVTNNNKVSLNYSNNPAASGLGDAAEGSTPEDYVWVFTYKQYNVKTDGTNPLSGAEFRLYSDEECNNEIGLIYDATLSAYRPIKSTGETATVMTSAETSGVFNIAGLDAGTYYLKETQEPAGGYNKLTSPITVIITATHKEDADGNTVDLTLTGNSSEGTPNEIVNKKGSSLPSTGGIGTTIFYVAGGVLVVGAGVLLVSKKRMSNK